MKKRFKKGVSAIMAGACLVMSLPCQTCLLSPMVSSAGYLEDVMTHLDGDGLVEMGSTDGMVYYIFNEDEQGTVGYSEDELNFNFEWDSVKNSRFCFGKEYSRVMPYDKFNKLTFEYSAELELGENDFYGLSFNLDDPDAECFIIDGWGSKKPFDAEQCLGTFTSNYVTYDIYKTTRTSGDGTVKDQYWSVAKASMSYPGDTSKVNSRVNIKEHLDAWKKSGLEIGGIKDIYFNINNSDSTGSASLSYLYIDEDFDYYDEYDEYDNRAVYYPESWEKEIDKNNIRGRVLIYG